MRPVWWIRCRYPVCLRPTHIGVLYTPLVSVQNYHNESMLTFLSSISRCRRCNMTRYSPTSKRESKPELSASLGEKNVLGKAISSIPPVSPRVPRMVALRPVVLILIGPVFVDVKPDMKIVSSQWLYLSSTDISPHNDGYGGHRSGTKSLGPCWPSPNSRPRRKPSGSPTILATASAPGCIPVRLAF